MKVPPSLELRYYESWVGARVAARAIDQLANVPHYKLSTTDRLVFIYLARTATDEFEPVAEIPQDRLARAVGLYGPDEARESIRRLRDRGYIEFAGYGRKRTHRWRLLTLDAER